MEKLQPGTYIDSHWGHYQSVELIEIAIGLGYEDNALDTDKLYTLCEAYRENYEDVSLKQKDGSTLILSDNGFSVAECVDEIHQDIESWINDNLVPEGYWFGHHPDLGDIGVWDIGVWEIEDE
jgi:hypothetical protein